MKTEKKSRVDEARERQQIDYLVLLYTMINLNGCGFIFKSSALPFGLHGTCTISWHVKIDAYHFGLSI